MVSMKDAHFVPRARHPTATSDEVRSCHVGPVQSRTSNSRQIVDRFKESPFKTLVT